jgi:hypothetical protein
MSTVSSPARAESEGQAAWPQLRNPVHGEPEKSDSKAIIQAMTEKGKKSGYRTIIRPRITCGLHQMRTQKLGA